MTAATVTVMASSYEDYCQRIYGIGKHYMLERFQVGLTSANHLWMESLPHFFHVLPKCTSVPIQQSEDSVTVCGSLFGLTSTEVFISN